MKKRNWGYFLIPMILVIISFNSLNSTVTAHSPGKMNISYDIHNSILMANITHSVVDNSTHYVSGVKICLKESVFKEYNYTSQPTNETFQYYYSIDAIKGDKIKVAAYCIEGGEIHDDLIVGAVNPNLEIPGYSFLLIILSVTIISSLSIVSKRLERKN